MGEENDSNVWVIGYDYTAYMDYMELTVRCLRKAI